jgi:hypothetical protein
MIYIYISNMLAFDSSCLFHVKTLDVNPYVICFGFKKKLNANQLG